MARHVSDTEARERAALERAQNQQVARQALGTVGQKIGQKVAERVDQGYDSAEKRGRRDAAREEAGVPLVNRRIVAVADQMNSQAPTFAAAIGRAQKTQTRTGIPVQDRTRGR